MLVEDADQTYLDLQIDDTLDQFGAASPQYRVILGPNAGNRVLTLRNPVTTTPASTSKPFTVARDGFSLNAAVSCQAHQRGYRGSALGKDVKAWRAKSRSEYVAIADRCLRRLNRKGNRLLLAGKHPNKVKVACAREMVGFVWESLNRAAAA